MKRIISGLLCTFIGMALVRGLSADPSPMRPVINARDHGARGDGVTNDAAALQVLFDHAAKGSTIYLPPGTCLLRSTFRLPSSAVLCGASE